MGSGVQHEFRIGGDPDAINELVADPSRSEDGPAAARSRLRAYFPAGVRMPAPGGWAAAADLLHYVVGLVREHRPSRIVEIGSGASTCWLAWALEVFDLPGRVVSLEHLSLFRRRTLNRLQACGVGHRAEVRHAALTDVDVDGVTYRWYDPLSWRDLHDCDLLLVDGPPGHTGRMARYPAVPLLGPALRPGARVVLDDYRRADEQKAVAAWRRRHPDWRLQVLEHKKRTAVLTVTARPTGAHPA